MITGSPASLSHLSIWIHLTDTPKGQPAEVSFRYALGEQFDAFARVGDVQLALPYTGSWGALAWSRPVEVFVGRNVTLHSTTALVTDAACRAQRMVLEFSYSVAIRHHPKPAAHPNALPS